MLVLITYDVSTSDSAGKRRLQKIARLCMNHGQRVQNSVFECKLDASELVTLRADLRSAMNEETDSLRIYNLGKQYHNRIEHIGAKETYLPDDVLMV